MKICMKKVLFFIISLTLFQICKAQDSLRLVLPVGIDGDQNLKNIFVSKNNKYLILESENRNFIYDLFSNKELPSDFNYSKILKRKQKVEKINIKSVTDATEKIKVSDNVQLDNYNPNQIDEVKIDIVFKLKGSFDFISFYKKNKLIKTQKLICQSNFRLPQCLYYKFKNNLFILPSNYGTSQNGILKIDLITGNINEFTGLVRKVIGVSVDYYDSVKLFVKAMGDLTEHPNCDKYSLSIRNPLTAINDNKINYFPFSPTIDNIVEYKNIFSNDYQYKIKVSLENKNSVQLIIILESGEKLAEFTLPKSIYIKLRQVVINNSKTKLALEFSQGMKNKVVVYNIEHENIKLESNFIIDEEFPSIFWLNDKILIAHSIYEWAGYYENNIHLLDSGVDVQKIKICDSMGIIGCGTINDKTIYLGNGKDIVEYDPIQKKKIRNIDLGINPYDFSIIKNDKIIVTTNPEKQSFDFYEMISGRLIFSIYSFINDNFFIKLPNSTYYMCSKDASKMLHYVTPSLKVIGFDQLDPIYNRPDIVLDSIGKYFAGGPDLKLIQQYKDAWVKRMTRLGLDTTTASNKIEVPDAEIVNADNIEYNNTSGKIKFHFKASDAKHNLRRYNVYVNEVPVYGSNGISISEKTNQFEKDISLNLTEGNNKIQVSVMNDLGLENFRYPVYVQYQPAKPIVSKTFYIGIGVDSFATSKFNLQYCVKDVNDLGNLLANDKNTKTIILKNKDVTKENVLKLKSFLQQTTEQDKVIISCSSHGLLDKNNNFYLAMNNVDFNHPELNGLAYEDLQGLLDGIPARKKLLLLDACNSGENEKSDNNGLANSKDLAIKQGAKGVEIESVSDSSQNKKNSFETMMELFVNVNNQTGATVVSAAGGKQSALEGGAVYINGKPISNGAFTYSILEYLTQHQNDKNKLTVNQLKQYAEQRVTEITNGKQKPTSRQETMEVDWGF